MTAEHFLSSLNQLRADVAKLIDSIDELLTYGNLMHSLIILPVQQILLFRADFYIILAHVLRVQEILKEMEDKVSSAALSQQQFPAAQEQPPKG